MSDNYYDHNLKRYSDRTRSRLDQDALNAFARTVRESAAFSPRVLDAGCGTGRDLKYFNRLQLNAEGFDSSEKMVALAGQESGCKVWQADLMLARLDREAYDGIWCHGVLSHFPPPGCQRAMGTFFAALKPRGILFVSVTEGEGMVEDRTDDPSGPARTLYRYRYEDFASLLRQSGFQILANGKSSHRADLMAFLARRI